MSDIHLEANHISKTFAKHRALDDVHIEVPRQSVFGLLGPNGAGKTTLIRIINQIIGPDKGEILLNGHPLERGDIAKIGYMPEERGLYRKMKVGEQAMYLAQLKGMSSKEAKAAIKYWFKAFEIEEWWDKKVEELSKGMGQKVQFITTVIHKPEILILDEPFSGFDPVNAELIKEELLKLRDGGTTIILSTHRMESVESLCDNIALINKSKVVLEGKVNEVRHRFKTNSFELILEHEGDQAPEIVAPGIKTTESSRQSNNMWHFFLQAEGNLNMNEVLQQAMKHGQVHLFREILPAINEIFIQLVKGNRNE